MPSKPGKPAAAAKAKGSKSAASAKNLTADQRTQLLDALANRFERNKARHPGVQWAKVLARLESRPERLWSLQEMERTSGEPDVVGLDKGSGEILFMDCSAESPSGRRSLCYDRDALDARKEAKPKGNAVETAAAMGIELLTEAQYRQLQELGTFDQTTSSWVFTPIDVRDLDGALFCDRRFGRVWVYHNGAQSYYAARGFRGLLRI